MIKHKMFETTNEKYIEEWVRNLNSFTKFNEIIIVGGDGLFSQYLNAIILHPDAECLLRIPIGILPGGSQNALCCDLGGKSPYIAM
jgi:sphingosine kinase